MLITLVILWPFFFSIPGLSSTEKDILKKNEARFVTLDGKPEYVIDKINNGCAIEYPNILFIHSINILYLPQIVPIRN